MTNQPPTNQQIVIEFLAKTSDVLKKYEDLNQKTEEAKAKIKELAKETGASFKEISDAMRLATIEEGKRNVDELKKKLTELRAEEKNYKRMSEEAIAKNKADIAETTRLLKEQANAGREAGVAIAQGQKKAAEEAKGLQSSVSGTAGTFKSVLSSLGALVGITSALALFQKVANFLSNAADQAKDFSQALFSMTVGVRALQRAGVEITIAEMSNQIENLKERFGIFSRVDLVQGAAAFLNLNRDMGFTKDQLFELQNAIATLAVVNGRSMDEVQKTVALAISSGYTEGLQRLGVSINRVTIAEEAARLGWEGGYTALNEQQRALATYNLVIRKTAIYLDDLLEYQRSLPGQIDKTSKAIQDQTVQLGLNLMGVKLWFQEVQLGFLHLANSIAYMKAGAFDDFKDAYIKMRMEAAEAIGQPFDKNDMARLADEAGKAWAAGVIRGGLTPKQLFEKYGLQSEKWTGYEGLTDVEVQTKTAQERVKAAVETHLDEMLEIQKEFQEQSTELWDEYQDDLQEMWQEHWDKEKEIFDQWAEDFLEAQAEHERRVMENREKHAEELFGIEQKYADDNLKAQEDYNRSVADTWNQYNNSVAKANETFRNREEDAEAKFQEKMRQLREGFLFDLEDAIRTRNARQVLTLIRRYNLDAAQAQREYQLEKNKMWRDYQQQLIDLARQRDQRLAQLWQELQTRFEAIYREYQRELAEEEKRNQEAEDKEEDSWLKRRIALADEYKKRSEKEDEQHQKDLDKRAKRYEDDLKELKDHMKDRYEEIAKALASEVTLTDTEMGNLLKVLTDTLGPGGEAQLIFDFYIQYANAAAAAAGRALAMQSYLPLAFNRNLNQSSWTRPTRGPKAEGGVEYASSAASATFGEAGPELAMFLPLSKAKSSSGNPAVGSIGGLMGGGNGKAAIEIMLSPGLEARIVDSALDNVADVIIRRLR